MIDVRVRIAPAAFDEKVDDRLERGGLRRIIMGPPGSILTRAVLLPCGTEKVREALAGGERITFDVEKDVVG